MAKESKRDTQRKQPNTTYSILKRVQELRKEHSAENDKSAEIAALLKEAWQLLPEDGPEGKHTTYLNLKSQWKSNRIRCRTILPPEQYQELVDLEQGRITIAADKEAEKEENTTALSSKETANTLATVLGGAYAYVQKREEENKNHLTELLNKDANNLTPDDIAFLNNYARDGLSENESNRLSALLNTLPEEEQPEPEAQPEPAEQQAQNDEDAPVVEPEQPEVVVEPEEANNEGSAADPVVEPEQPEVVVEPEEANNEGSATDPIIIGAEDEKEDENEDEDEDENEDEDELDEEVETYMDEIRNSEANVSSYLSNFIEIKSAGIEGAMAAGVTYEQIGDTVYQNISATDRAIAFGSANNILTAYEYYAKKDPSMLDELDDVAIAFLRAPENKELLTTDTANNAYAILALADRIRGKDKDLYNQVTSTLATSLKAYDTEKFGTLDEETLAANYHDLEQALKELPAEDMMKVLNRYTFTDDKGNELTDKQREAAQKDVLDLARAMAAEQLVKIGVPEDKNLLNQYVQEQIEFILDKGVDERLKDAAEKLHEQQAAEFTHTWDVKTDLLNQGDEQTINIAAVLLAVNELKLPRNASEEDKKKLQAKTEEYAEKLKNKDNDTIQKAAHVLTRRERGDIKSKEDWLKDLQSGNRQVLDNAATLLARKEKGFFPEDEATLSTLDKIAFDKIKNNQFKELTAAQKTQKTFTHSELTGRLAAGMSHAETFKKRIGQHFGENKLFKGVSSWLQKVDKKLTKKYGKKYTQTKKVVKTVAQFGWGMAKSFAMMTAASACGPAGMAAYMGYMAYKQGKSVIKDFKDPNKTNWEKFASLGGAAITGALTVGGLGGAVGQLAGEHAPAFAQNMSNMISQMNWGVRASIVTFAQTLPNQVKGISLRHKIKKIQKAIANETDPKKINALITKHADLKESQKQNLIGMGAKALGTFAASGIMSSDFVQNLRAECLTAIGGGAAAAPDAQTPENQDAAANANTDANSAEAQAAPTNANTDANSAEAQDGSANANTDANSAEAQDGSANANTDANSAEAQDGSANANTDANSAEAQDGSANANTDANSAEVQDGSANNEDSNGNPDDTLGRRAQNLAAAQEQGSGHLGKSDLDSIQKDMNSHHGNLLNFSADEKAALMKSLAEGYGTNSYEAMHAAMAEPNTLAHAMGLEGNYTSATLLNHMAAHPELADNAGFKAYVAEHFDAQDRFHYTSQPTTTHQPAPTPTPTPTPAPQPQTTPVDNLPEEQPNLRPENVTINIHIGQEGEQPTTTPLPQDIPGYQSIPAHIPANNGLIYDPMLSEGLDHSKYAGAYLDPNRIIDGKPAVVYIPHDTLHDTPHVINMDDAMKAHNHAGGDTLGLYYSRTGTDLNNPENNYNYYGYGHGGYGYGPRVCYGSGNIDYTTVSTREISFGEALGREVAVRATDTVLRQGEHALHHAIDKVFGRG